MSAMRDPTDLRSQELRTESDEAKAEKRRHQEVEDFKWLMAHKQGRRIVWGLLEQAGVFRSSFTGNSETFFREGQRNVGLRLISQIHEHCPDKYPVMLEEQKQHDD